MQRLFITILSLTLLSLLSACSSTDEEDLEPAELVDFEPERRLIRQWSTGISDGQGDLYNRIVPAVAGDRVVIAGADGDIKAVDLAEGDKLWDVDTDLPTTGAVGVDDDGVYLGTTDGTVVALELASGEQRWRAQLSGEVLAPPRSNGHIVAVQTQDGKVYGLDTHSGEQRWLFSASVPPLSLRGTAAPLIHDKAVVVGLGSGKVVAIDAENGKMMWETRVGTPTGSTEIERLVDVDGELLANNQGVIHAVSYQGQVVAIDPRSGRRLWARDSSSHVGMAEGFGNIYVVGAEGAVTAFNQTGQGVRWEQTALARRGLSGAATWGSYVAVGDFEGYLHLLSQVDGHLVARTKVDGDGIRVAPLVVDDRLLVYGNSGRLAAYELNQPRSQRDDDDGGWFD